VPSALVGSVRAALRSSASPSPSFGARLEIRGMVLDGELRSLRFDGRKVEFTHQEWDLLIILAGHPNHYLGAREILRQGWRTGEHGTEQVRIYIRRLRHKVDPMDLPFKLLSRHGQGYCMSFN
jgi:two-component system, OmpR family, alkaline phosphatase synthesis response regulator PhoP